MTFPGRSARLATETTRTPPAPKFEAVYAIVPERRRDGRFAQSRPVAIYDPYASRFFGGQTIDVSAAGLKLRLPGWVNLRAGRIIDLHTGTESGALPLANRRRVVLCRVVWTRAHRAAMKGDAQYLLVGVEFLSTVNAEAA